MNYKTMFFMYRARKLYGVWYDLHLVKYVNAKTPVKLICPIHGVFEKTPDLFLNRNRGCPFCSHNTLPKEFGYWNNLEHCLEEAKKYPNKGQFQKNCYSAYNAMRRNGWVSYFNEIYKDQVKVFPAMNEPIHCVYVYEMTEYNTCYVGRTNGIKKRDRAHRKGFHMHDSKKRFDTLYKFCKDNEIEIPQPIILADGLTAIESQEKEGYYVDKYKTDGWNVLNVAPTGIGKSSLGGRLKWTYEKCKKEATKYPNRTQFKVACPCAYNSAKKFGWLDDFLPKRKIKWTYDACEKEASKYKTRGLFQKGNASAYIISLKKGWIKDFFENKNC